MENVPSDASIPNDEDGKKNDKNEDLDKKIKDEDSTTDLNASNDEKEEKENRENSTDSDLIPFVSPKRKQSCIKSFIKKEPSSSSDDFQVCQTFFALQHIPKLSFSRS